MGSRRKTSRKNRANPQGRQADGQPPIAPTDTGTDTVGRRRFLSRWHLLVLATVLLAVGWFAVVRTVSQRRFGQGLAALRIHLFELADQRFEQAGSWHQRGGEVALLRGRVAWVKGDLEASKEWIKTAAIQGLDPQRAEQERLLAQIRSGSAAGQRSRLPTMLRRRPEDGPAILEAFTAGFLARGDVDQATELLSLWEEADAKDPRIHYWRGTLNRAFGNEAEAIGEFERALRNSPNMAPARMALADLLKSFYFYPEALVQYQRVLAEQPSTEDARLGLAICQLRTGQVDEGVTALTAVIAADPEDVPARLALAEHYQDNMQPREVLTTIQPLLNAGTIDISMNYFAATAFSRLGDEAQAARYFEDFQRLSRQLETTKFLIEKYERKPSFQLARQIAAELLQCKWQDAGTWILEALSIQPRNAELNQMMAEYLRRSGRQNVADSYEQYAGTLRAQQTSGP